jgi:predicted nucleic acid-binding protein
MICVDATVLIDLFVGEPQLKAAASSLFGVDPLWVSSGLWRYEVTHVLGKYVRLGKLDTAAAKRHLQRAETLIYETVEISDLPTLLTLGADKQLTGYDASYVWVAKSRKLKLHTRDDKILASCPELAHPMPVASS